jgi:hypothetical protein
MVTKGMANRPICTAPANKDDLNGRDLAALALAIEAQLCAQCACKMHAEADKNQGMRALTIVWHDLAQMA